MKKNKRWTIILLIIAVIVILANACGKGDDKPHGGNSVQTGSGSHNGGVDSALQDSEEADDEQISFPQTPEEIVEYAMSQSIVDEEKANASEKFTNAIVENTRVEILEEDTDSCTLKIKYPDVKTIFLSAVEQLPDNPNQNDIDGVYAAIQKKLLDGELNYLETTLEVPIVTDEKGRIRIEWTVEAQNAMSGGLYEIYYEGMKQLIGN